jgi:putative ABC transport system permease protein
MLINYFKIAWRNMMKSKIFSFINIFGLAIGLTCCMLITRAGLANPVKSLKAE